MNITILTVESLQLIFDLNEKQFLALKIFLQDQISNEQILFYLGGDGGTGKTRVILAINFYFWFNNEYKNLKIAAYTGTAANLIYGNTIHGTFKFQINQNEKNYFNITLNDTIDWETVTHLIIDEISMVSCNLLTEIDRSLRELKRKNIIYGGLHILFSGDFFQLPPVASVPLYVNYDLSMNNEIILNKTQDSFYGRWLWLQLNRVLFLDIQMRQKDDTQYADFLKRVKLGECTNNDIAKIKTKIITNTTQIDKPIPTIVSNNKLKLNIISKTITTIEQNLNIKIKNHQAEDKIKIKNIYEKPPKQIEKIIKQLDDSKTGYLVSNLPIHPSITYYLTNNVSVILGLTNGITVNILKTILDINTKQILCILAKPINLSVEFNFSELPNNVFPIFPLVKYLKINFPTKSINVKRSQFPLIPNYSSTCYKVQGKTLEKMCLDLSTIDCKTIECSYIYVSLSRLTSWDGLYILRDFDESIFFKKPSPDLLKEIIRLKEIEKITLKKFFQ
ncbi:unnamed protein product [Brachionus calyciflorus]|uniref:ATP-dependent DNA helicase n=1 Tax=Brachionus calyciflorus TaxID=104777 RepID=A0A813TB16_9BILA|nr:unnamed protein product [Brachionus calyciflorus]